MKILYLSCHETLEAGEVNILRSLGHNVFTVGFYTYPSKDPTLYPVAENDPYLLSMFERYRHKHKPGLPLRLNSHFVAKFDLIINAYWQENIRLNNFGKIPVIYRSIGLTDGGFEIGLKKIKSKCKLIRMTESEANVPNFAGSDGVIRVSVDPNVFYGWHGNSQHILTVSKWIKIDASRMFGLYERVTEPFEQNRLLCGKNNHEIPYAFSNISNKELQFLRQNSRVYFAMHTKNAAWTYTFLEAMVTGMPVVSIGQGFLKQKHFENPSIIKNGENAFISDNVNELQDYIRMLLNDYDLAKKISHNGRKTALELVHPDKIAQDWKNIIESI